MTKSPNRIVEDARRRAGLPDQSVLIRISDGREFTRNRDGTYSMKDSMMARPYRYSYARLMDTGAFKIKS